MLRIRLIHHISEGLDLPEIVARLAAAHVDMRDVELGLSRLMSVAERLAGASQPGSAARATAGPP